MFNTPTIVEMNPIGHVWQVTVDASRSTNYALLIMTQMGIWLIAGTERIWNIAKTMAVQECLNVHFCTVYPFTKFATASRIAHMGKMNNHAHCRYLVQEF